MSSICKNGNLWWYYANGSDGKKIRISLSRYAGYKVKSRTDARAFQLQLDLRYGRHEPGAIRRVTFETFEVRFLEYAKAHKAPRSVVNDKYVMRIFRDYWHGKYINELTLEIIDGFLTDLGQRKRMLWTKNGMIYIDREITRFGRSMIHRALRSIFNKAVEWEYMSVNPFSVRKVLKVPKKVVRSIPEAHLGLIFEVIRKHYPKHVDLYLSYLLTGARRQELLDTRWENFNWQNKILTVHGKGDKERTIPLLPTMLRLVQHRQSLGAPGPFCDISGSWVSHAFHRACKLAGFNYKLHDLRKSYGTILAKAGVPIPVIQSIMGHEDERTTREAYLDMQIQGQVPNMESLDRFVNTLLGVQDLQRN